MSDEGGLKKMVLEVVAILTLSVVVLVGIVVVGGFSEILRTKTNTSITGLNLSWAGVDTQVGTGGTYPFLQDLTGCVNATEIPRNLSTGDYIVYKGDKDGGSIQLRPGTANDTWANAVVNCSGVSYLADSSNQASADSFSTGLAIFGTFLAVIALAIVGRAIIRLFRGKGDDM